MSQGENLVFVSPTAHGRVGANDVGGVFPVVRVSGPIDPNVLKLISPVQKNASTKY